MPRSLVLAIRPPAQAVLCDLQENQILIGRDPVVPKDVSFALLPELLVDVQRRQLNGLLFPIRKGFESLASAFVRQCDQRCVTIQRPPPAVGSGQSWPNDTKVIEVRWCPRIHLEGTQVASLTEVSWLWRHLMSPSQMVETKSSCDDIVGIRVALIDDILHDEVLVLPTLDS